MKSKNMEIYFDIVYLLLALIFGVLLVMRPETLFWGVMALILAFGDSTHLLPRIYQICTGKKTPFFIGYGKMITSITMSVFYMFLWHIGCNLYSLEWSSYLIYSFCIIRIFLCILPYNQWSSSEPSYAWGIYRNIPFVAQGCVVFLLFFLNRANIPSLRSLYIAIVLSFAFYIPVVLGSRKKPILGMLMLPKTLCYLWIITIGFSLWN